MNQFVTTQVLKQGMEVGCKYVMLNEDLHGKITSLEENFYSIELSGESSERVKNFIRSGIYVLCYSKDQRYEWISRVVETDFNERPHLAMQYPTKVFEPLSQDD